MNTRPGDRPHRRRLIVAMVGIAVLGLLAWGFVESRREQAIEPEPAHAKPADSQVSEDRGEAVVTLDVAAQTRSAIRAIPLTATRQRMELRGFATVLDPQLLGADRIAYAQARSESMQARAALVASSAELERTKSLNRDDKNLSDKALEAARASQQADHARVQAADLTARLQADTARQHWGAVIAGWFATDALPLRRLMSLQEVLLRVALPADITAGPFPETVRIAIGSNDFVTAYLISVAPQVDPQLQSVAAFYRAPAEGLQPGRNVDVWLPQGDRERAGAVVPQSAVVWWQGRGWMYQQRGPTRFVRREVDTSAPVAGGYFMAEAGLVGQRVVVTGAQLLLSEEFRAQIQGGEEGGE